MVAGQMPTVHFAAFCLHVVALERIEKVKTKERLVLTREIVEREKPNDFLYCLRKRVGETQFCAQAV